MPRPADCLRSPRASILVVVLVTIVFASLLLTRMIETSSADLLVAMRLADRERLRGDAQAALETTLAVLAEFRAIDRGLYAPAQGWADPLTYAGYTPRAGVTLEVAFEDESGKLSLPALRPEQVREMLVKFGLAAPDAARVADALLVWMRADYPAGDSEVTAAAYGRLDPAFQPPRRGLRDFSELATISVARDFFFDADGRPTALHDEFTRRVSLYRFSGTNLNTADPAVLVAFGWAQEQADRLVKHRTTVNLGTRTPPYFRSIQEARRSLGGEVAMNGLSAAVSCLRVTVTAREGAAALQVSTLIATSSQVRLPPSVASDSSALTGGRLGGNRAQAGGVSRSSAAGGSTNSLRYPFTVLEMTEGTPPPVPAS